MTERGALLHEHEGLGGRDRTWAAGRGALHRAQTGVASLADKLGSPDTCSRTVTGAFFAAVARRPRRLHDHVGSCPELDRYLLGLERDSGVQRARPIAAGDAVGPLGPCSSTPT